MAALPSPGAFIKVTLKGTNEADANVVNRLYFAYSTLGSQSQMNTFATAIATEWNSQLAPWYHTTFALTQVTVEDLAATPGATGIWNGSHAGTLSGSPLAGGTAVVISQKITRRYRGGKPRVYLQAMDGSHLDNATTWNATALASLLTAWTTFAGYVAAYNTAPILITGAYNISYYHGFTPFQYPSGRYKNRPDVRGTPVTDSIISYSANPGPGSQRRRNYTG